MFLPPVQAIADIIPGVGSIIKGMLRVLRLVDVIRLHSRVLLGTPNLNLATIEVVEMA